MKLHVVGCLLLLLTAVSVLPAPAATVSDRVITAYSSIRAAGTGRNSE